MSRESVLVKKIWAMAVSVILAGCGQSNREPLLTVDAPQVAVEAPLFEIEEGFQLLSLADFEQFQADAGTWSEDAGLLTCSGTPKGYAHTRDLFRNFTLRADFRYLPAEGAENLEKSNTGFMIHIQEPHKVWPRSLEVQGRWDELATIKSNGGVPELTIDDRPDVRERVRRAVEEWNSVEIISQDGSLVARLNGEVVCESQPGEVEVGLLGLQAEGFAVQFRNLRVRRE